MEETMGLSNQTETRVQLKGVHLCCGGCTDAVATAVENVPGATCECDMEGGTVTVTARDRAAAQKALDAIADAGLHGETGDVHLAMRAERDIPPGKVRRLTVSGIHNCCLPCYEAIKGAIDSVEGVSDDTAGPGRITFDVTGNFSAAELVRALNTAGFHAKARL
jgi:mercuric ion binding protein